MARFRHHHPRVAGTERHCRCRDRCSRRQLDLPSNRPHRRGRQCAAPGHSLRHRHACHAGDRRDRAGTGRPRCLLPALRHDALGAIRGAQDPLAPHARARDLARHAADPQRHRLYRLAADRRRHHRSLRRRRLCPALRPRYPGVGPSLRRPGRADRVDGAANLDLRDCRPRSRRGGGNYRAGRRHTGHHRHGGCSGGGDQRWPGNDQRHDDHVRVDRLFRRVYGSATG